MVREPAVPGQQARHATSQKFLRTRSPSGWRSVGLFGVEYEPVGHGLRVPVASPGDLVRMLSALDREEDAPKIETIRRVVELDRGLELGL